MKRVSTSFLDVMDFRFDAAHPIHNSDTKWWSTTWSLTSCLQKCRRCIALGIPQPIARERGLCRWCLIMGTEDNRLRALKGMPTYPLETQES